MLAIRLKRVGRSNLAQYRVIVQDARRHPKRGAVIEYLGTYNPHAKTLEVDKDRVKHYLDNGARPSNVVARLFKADKIKLPKWVEIEKNPKRKTRNPEKLRKNQPKEAKAEEKPAEEPKEETPAEETKSEEKPKEESAAEGKTEEPKEETKDQPEEEPKKEETKDDSKSEEKDK